MNIYAFIPFICGLLCLSTGFYIFLKKRKPKLSWIYFLSSLSIFCYCFLFFSFVQFADKKPLLTILTKIFSPGGFLIIPSFLSLLFWGKGKKDISKFLCGFSWLFGLSALIFLFTNCPIEFNFFSWGCALSLQNLPYFLFFLNTVLFLPLAIIIAWSDNKDKDAPIILKKQKGFYIFILALAGFSIFLNFLPSLGLKFYPWGTAFLAFSFMAMAYPLTGYRFLELDFMVNKTILAVSFIVPLLLVHVMVSGILLETMGFLFSSTLSLIIVVIILLVTPYKKLMQEFIDKTIYRGRYDYQKILKELSKTLIAILDFEQLLECIVQVVVQTIDVDRIAIFLKDEEKLIYCIKSSFGVDKGLERDLILEESDKIIKHIKQEQAIVVKAELSHFEKEKKIEELYKKLKPIHAELIVPLFLKEDLRGFLVLGQKKSGQIYNQMDIDVLTSFAASSIEAIENARMFSAAIYDDLTQIFHRHYFLIRLKEEIARAKRYIRPLALLMVDIDSLKDINKTFDYKAGDLLLKNIGRLIKNKIRNVDIPCRYTGEEFAVILPDIVQASAKNKETGLSELKNDALLVAGRLRKSIEDLKIDYQGEILNITASIGISTFDGQDKNFKTEDLVKHARMALYQAKNEGKNKVIFYSEKE